MKTTIWMAALLMVSAMALGCESDDSDDNTGNTESASETEGTEGSETPDPEGESGDEGGEDNLRGADNPPTLGAQIDRAGRAAISTATVGTFMGDEEAKGMLKNEYNAAGPEGWADFTENIRGSLAILDALDGNCGNQLAADLDPAARYMGLAGVLADDQLYVNSGSGECGTYLGLEAEIVGVLGAGEGGCGGRTPSDDVIERSYSVLGAGILAGVDDGVAADDGAQTDEFPFLGAPAQ